MNIFFQLLWDNHKQDTQSTISNQLCTHSTQGFWSGIPGQATNKKLSMDRICTGNTSNFFCNWGILGASLCLNMQTNTHAQGQSHSIQSGATLIWALLTWHKHNILMQHESVSRCMHKHTQTWGKHVSDEAVSGAGLKALRPASRPQPHGFNHKAHHNPHTSCKADYFMSYFVFLIY